MQIKSITIPRGSNVGQAIKNKLIDLKLYKKVNVISFDIKRDVRQKTVTASITYKYKN